MMRFPLFGVVLLFGAVDVVSAQSLAEAKFGQFLRGAISVTQPSHRPHSLPTSRRASAPVCHPAPRGHWETVHEQVLVPGYWQQQHLPPTYGWITDACGYCRWGVIDGGGCRQVWVAQRWEARCR